MYKCEDCEQIFGEPELSKDSVEYFGESTHLESKICPYCNSEYIYETHLCRNCNENYVEDGGVFCKECQVEIQECLNNFIKAFTKCYKLTNDDVLNLMDNYDW